jgi:hypothetical protein
MFFLPNNVSLRGAGWSAGGRPRIYAVHNGRTNPEFDNVKRRTLPIAKRSLATLMKTQTRSDIYDIANLADRNGADAVLASIGQDFTATASAPFDQNYMRQLFAYGEAKGRAGGFSAIEDGLVSSRSGQ